jgi:hypothetical protein
MTWPPTSLVREFLARLHAPPNSCVLWNGPMIQQTPGMVYGRWSHRGDTDFAHRTAYRLAHGGDEIATGLTVDHLCHTTICVNPEHLSLKPNRENAGKSGARRRARSGPIVIPDCFQFLDPVVNPRYLPINGHEPMPDFSYWHQPELWASDTERGAV